MYSTKMYEVTKNMSETKHFLGTCGIYISTTLWDKLEEETQSDRLHNIDAEEVMGMNSALHKKAPTATISFVTSKIKARKNDTVEYYLEQMDNLDLGYQTNLTQTH